MPSTTGPQVLSSSGNELVRDLSTSYATYRLIKKDPTVALARALSMAPILTTEWAVHTTEGAPEGAEDFIEDQILPLQSLILENSLRGSIDFGWAPFEKVYEIFEGKIVLSKLKPLLQDITIILVDQATGAFAGLRQEADTIVTLPLELSFLISFRVEGTQWYGYPLLENTLDPYNKWNAVEVGAKRYDDKVAGSHFVVHYPQGTSEVNGVEVTNSVAAQGVINDLAASKSIAVPMRKLLDDVEESWKIELLGDQIPKQYAFVARQEYYDRLKVRSLLMPERTLTEGRFGNKADAQAHADLAVSAQETNHRHILQHVNWFLVNDLLRFNWGPEAENTVTVGANSLVDADRAYLQKIYETILTAPEGFIGEVGEINTEEMRGKLGIPSEPNPVIVSVLDLLKERQNGNV